MTSTLWAIEANTKDGWVLLPNLIFVARNSASWELGNLEPDYEYSGFRLVRYQRSGLVQ
jgi:hypothetical protein